MVGGNPRNPPSLPAFIYSVDRQVDQKGVKEGRAELAALPMSCWSLGCCIQPNPETELLPGRMFPAPVCVFIGVVLQISAF